MVTLRIFLMGLVPLVPEEGPKLRVIVPNAATMSHHEHYPVFVWDARNNNHLGQGGYIADKLNVGGGFGGYLLSGQEVTLEPMTKDALEFPGGVDSGPSRRRMMAKMPNTSTAAHFGWIPSMKTLTDGEGSLHHDFYHPSDPAKVAGWLRLDRYGGSVKTYSFADLGHGLRAMKFVGLGRKPFMTCRQAVADVAVIEMTFEDRDLPADKHVTFTGTGFDKRVKWDVELMPYEDGEKYRIDVLIGNLTPLMLAEADMTPEATLHFDLYNAMLQATPGYSDRRFPVLGRRSMEDANVDPPFHQLAPIVQAVSRPPIAAGIARPICMLATFQAPR